MDNEQTVATEADVQSNSESEVTSAQDELEAALAEFDKDASTETEQTTDTPSDVSDEDKAFIERLRQKELQSDISSAVDTIKDKLEAPMDEEFIEGVLEVRVRKDPQMQKAWLNREANPQAWNSVLNGLSKDISERAKSLPDPQATADRQAVEAAVHSAATTTPAQDLTDKDIMSMPANDFAKEQAKYGVR